MIEEKKDGEDVQVGNLARPDSPEDTLSIKSELELIGLARTYKPIEDDDEGSKGLLATVMGNIRSFFTGW